MKNFEMQQFITKEGKQVEICHLMDGDEEVLHCFQAKIADETTHTLLCREKMIPIMRLKEKIQAAYESPVDLLLGVFDNKCVVANLSFRVAYHDHPWIKHIGEFGMSVLKEYWGQGIGKALLAFMEQFALSIGVKRIEAKVRCTNERGVALYQRSGFKIEGIRENGAYINGQFEHEYFISKLFTEASCEI